MFSTFDQALDMLCGKEQWIAYCINLERSKERKDVFSNWAKMIGLTFNWWKATDKLNLVEDDYKLCDVYVNGTIKQDGATACRISHHRLQEYLLSSYPNKKYYFILEDDAGFLYPEKKNLLFSFIEEIIIKKYKWDHIWFGFHDTGMRRMFPISKNVSIYEQTHLCHSMLLSREQVQYHLENILKNPKFHRLAIDWTIDILRLSKIGVTIGPVENIIQQVDKMSFIWT
jgi:hypothetical protein